MVEKNSKNFNVMDMARQYADDNDMELDDIFIKKSDFIEERVDQESVEAKPNEKKMWTPDAELIEDMEDLNSEPVTYSKDEFKIASNNELKNISDDNATESSLEAMSELDRKHANINIAKKRHGIVHFQIPQGQYHASIFAAAGDTNHERAQTALDDIFNEIKTTYPEFILQWDEFHEVRPIQTNATIIDIPTEYNKSTDDNDIEEVKSPSEVIIENDDKDDSSEDNVRIIIDKTSVSEITWDKDEIDKIKRSRQIELKIVEDINLSYNSLIDVDDNDVDIVLSQYQRHMNDVLGALPASKYRATFTGLTYTETLDLQYSSELNSLDGERKKWTIAFNHIKNQSIGPWEEYQYYIDPETKKEVRFDINAIAPSNIPVNKIHKITKFDDFLKKTSFLDLNFILWKILCATAMEQEIISIDCHGNLNNVPCGKSYDWIYNPSSILDMSSMSELVLQDMKITTEANSAEEIKKNYMSAMLNVNNSIKLTTSGYTVVFGHISAYDYLDSVYSEVKKMEDDDNNASSAISAMLLPILKSFIIPQEDGIGKRIRGTKNLIKVLNTLDEIDWLTLGQLVEKMFSPYQFKYSLRDIICPHCHTRSNIDISDITELLFIIAQSLNSVEVSLRSH